MEGSHNTVAAGTMRATIFSLKWTAIVGALWPDTLSIFLGPPVPRRWCGGRGAAVGLPPPMESIDAWKNSINLKARASLQILTKAENPYFELRCRPLWCLIMKNKNPASRPRWLLGNYLVITSGNYQVVITFPTLMLINEYDDEILPHLSLPPPLPHWPVRNAPEAGQQAGRRCAGFFDYCVLVGVRFFLANCEILFTARGGNLCRPEKKCENYVIGCGSMWSS